MVKIEITKSQFIVVIKWFIFLGVFISGLTIFATGLVLAGKTYEAVHTTTEAADLTEIQAYCISLITMVIGIWITAKSLQFSTNEKEKE